MKCGDSYLNVGLRTFGAPRVLVSRVTEFRPRAESMDLGVVHRQNWRQGRFAQKVGELRKNFSVSEEYAQKAGEFRHGAHSK